MSETTNTPEASGQALVERLRDEADYVRTARSLSPALSMRLDSLLIEAADACEAKDAEITRAVLLYTAKGYAAGENTDAKHWREAAEAAEAKLAALSGGVSDCAICGGLVRFDGREGDRIDPNCWGGRAVPEKRR